MPLAATIAIVAVAGLVVGSVAAALIATSVNGAEQRLADSPRATVTVPSVPAPSAVPTPSPAEPADPGTTQASGGTGVVSLDENARFATSAAPIWGVPLQEGWEPTIIDQNGVNSLTDTRTGCILTTSQNQGESVDVGTGDRVVSEKLLDYLLQGYSDTLPDAQPMERGAIVEIAATAENGDSLEFITATVGYTGTEPPGKYITEMGVREMPAQSSSMFFTVSCPEEAAAASPSPFDEVVGLLSVMDGGF